MQREINCLAEFKDKDREKEFYANEVQKGLRLSKNTVIIFGVCNFLFVLIDYFYLQYSDISVIIYDSLVPRAIILAGAVFIYILLARAKNKSAAIKYVAVFAVVTYLLHEYSAVHFAPVDLVFEVLDLVILTYGLFIIPNRWITNVCTSALISVIFIALTVYTIPTMGVGTKVTLCIYLFFQVLIVSVLMYRNHIQRRLNYLQQLQLEALAKTDVLTAAFNRVACDKALNQMCAGHCDFSLVLVDIDNFKQINDTYGHLAGDQVIVKTVDSIKKIVRQDDIVARWGGEEFVILLPHTPLERAAETAERIKKYLPAIEHGNMAGAVSASFGVTAFMEGDDMNSIIGRADKLLYQAKKQGKNKVVFG